MIKYVFNQNVGVLEANQSKEIHVEMLPLLAGLQFIQGVVVVELETQVEFPLDKRVPVLVDRA